MRISLPVHPHFKTSIEVATIALLQSQTSVPVPHIVASDFTSDNEKRFEWILMKRVHGLPLAEIWASLIWDAKVSCVKDVASIMAQLFELRYDSIGNLFNTKDLSMATEHANQNNSFESDIVVLDQIVSMPFFWSTHLKSNVNRGPFALSKKWLDARIQLLEEDLTLRLQFPDLDQDEIREVEGVQQ